MPLLRPSHFYGSSYLDPSISLSGFISVCRCHFLCDEVISKDLCLAVKDRGDIKKEMYWCLLVIMQVIMTLKSSNEIIVIA